MTDQPEFTPAQQSWIHQALVQLGIEPEQAAAVVEQAPEPAPESPVPADPPAELPELPTTPEPDPDPGVAPLLEPDPTPAPESSAPSTPTGDTCPVCGAEPLNRSVNGNCVVTSCLHCGTTIGVSSFETASTT